MPHESGPTSRWAAIVAAMSQNEFAPADPAGLQPPAGRKHRNMFARVIGAGRRRIAAMIGGQHHEVALAQDRHQIR